MYSTLNFAVTPGVPSKLTIIFFPAFNISPSEMLCRKEVMKRFSPGFIGTFPFGILIPSL